MPIMLLDTLKDYKVYLCSKSPRRQELLAGMGIDFEYLPTNVEEKHPDTDNPVEAQIISLWLVAAVVAGIHGLRLVAAVAQKED